MSLLILIRTAYESLSKNKFRTFLTMLGIIIGVAAVIVMQAIGTGTADVINSRIASLGTNLIFISPAAAKTAGVRQALGTQESLTIDDVFAIQKFCSDVAYVTPIIRSTSQVKYGGKNWRTTVMGVSSNYLQIRDTKVTTGVSFNDNDIRNIAKYCLIGKTVQDNLFAGNENPLGKTIRIGSVPFKIIGTLEPKGQSGFGQDQDDIIIAPYSSVKDRITGSIYIQQIFASAKSLGTVDKAVTEITNTLRNQHRIEAGTDDDFQINTQSEIASTARTITGALTSLLASIAAISLLVGGIGIMNIMLVSVAERTREIGIRLAIGATAFDILTQLLIESVVLSLTAGLLGILIGVGFAKLISNLIGWETVIKPSTEMISFMISTLIGVFFGWYPARKAATLDPIEALRYE